MCEGLLIERLEIERGEFANQLVGMGHYVGEPIGQILIPSPSGALIPLGQLAKVEVVGGPAQISRDMAQRRVVVLCNVTGRDIGGFVNEARERIDAASRSRTCFLPSASVLV